MADKKKGGMLQPTPYNESPGGPDSPPNISGAGIYVDYDEVMSAHLSSDSADLGSTPNMESIEGIVGGPAPGEPNPAKIRPTG